MGLILRNKNEDIKKYMNKRELLKVVYGITFAEDFLEETGMKPDYFCDVKAERENLSVNGIQVITKETAGKPIPFLVLEFTGCF